MKKYIGLLCGAMLLVALVAGCSGAYGFDDNNGGGSGGGNPFAGTSWTCYSMWVKFEENTAVYYTGAQKFTLDYSPKRNGDGSYEAEMRLNGQSWGSFKIASADADTGSFAGYSSWKRD